MLILTVTFVCKRANYVKLFHEFHFNWSILVFLKAAAAVITSLALFSVLCLQNSNKLDYLIDWNRTAIPFQRWVHLFFLTLRNMSHIEVVLLDFLSISTSLSVTFMHRSCLWTSEET